MNHAAVIRLLTECGAATAALNAEHDALDGCLRSLSDLVMAGASGATTAALLHLAFQFCTAHFGHEERFMYEHGYAGTQAHAAAHKQFLARLQDIEARMTTEEASLAALDAAGLIHDLHEHVEAFDRPAHDYIEVRVQALWSRTAAE